jgi:hypothetical protein
VSFVGLSVGFPRYARGALRFFVYLEAHCAFLIYITLLIKKKKEFHTTFFYNQSTFLNVHNFEFYLY